MQPPSLTTSDMVYKGSEAKREMVRRARIVQRLGQTDDYYTSIQQNSQN